MSIIGTGGLGEIPENVLIGNKLKSESDRSSQNQVIDAFSSEDDEEYKEEINQKHDKAELKTTNISK